MPISRRYDPAWPYFRILQCLPFYILSLDGQVQLEGATLCQVSALGAHSCQYAGFRHGFWCHAILLPTIGRLLYCATTNRKELVASFIFLHAAHYFGPIHTRVFYDRYLHQGLYSGESRAEMDDSAAKLESFPKSFLAVLVRNEFPFLRRQMHEKLMTSLTLLLFHCSWYVLSFMVTLPLLIISYFLKFRSYDSYYLFLVAGFLAPLQGTLNAFVYFHRDKKFRCLTYWCQCVCFRPKRAEGSSVLVTGSVPVVAPGIPRISSNIRSEYVSRKSHQSKHIASMASEASLTMDPVNEEQSQESSQEGDEFAGVLDFWDLMYQNDDQLDTEGNSVRGTNNAAEEANENSASREDNIDENSGRLLRFLHTIRAHGFDPQTEESNDQQRDCDKEQKKREKWEDSSLERQEEPQAFA